jgi:hypothetical protein
MDFALSRIYVKFYICQILNSMSYHEMKKKQLEFQELIEYSYMEETSHKFEEIIQPENIVDSLIITEEVKSESNQKLSSQSLPYDVKLKNSDPGLEMRIPMKNYGVKDLSQNYESPIYRKYFVYKNLVFSKVEIQGLVVEIQNLGYEDKNNLRYVIYIDDSTGVIQAISWKNNSNKVYEKIEKSLVK